MALAVGLGELLDKYDRLVALRQGVPGRTEARRDAMRAITARYPGALREWDALPEGELARRRDVVRRAIAEAAAGGSPALRGEPWLPFALELHGCLRAILAERRAGTARPGRAGRPSELALGEVARRHGVEVADVKRALFSAPEGA